MTPASSCLSIDALSLLYYKDIVGLKEPFDCGVCVSELSFLDKLKVLPNCSHSIHIHLHCLLLNSAYTLCRSLIGFENSADNPLFSTCDLDHQWCSLSCPIGPSRSSPAGLAWALSVRLGKFRSDMKEWIVKSRRKTSY